MTSFLDKETLTLIQDTAKKSVAAEIKAMPNDPQKVLVIAEGKATILDTPFVSPPRKHTVESVESFAAAYNRWSKDSGEAKADDGRMPNIWIDLANWRLMFFVDEPLRRSSVTLKLAPSPQLLLLQRFDEEQALDQKTLVRMLRHDLAECVDAGVLAAFRSVDFQKIISARANIQHEKQSLDSDIVAQITGEKKPDWFLVETPLFAMRELADALTRVGLTIDIDCDNRRFVLQAKPGHLEMALDDARAAVLTKLENDLAALGHEQVMILAGNPE